MEGQILFLWKNHASQFCDKNWSSSQADKFWFRSKRLHFATKTLTTILITKSAINDWPSLSAINVLTNLRRLVSSFRFHVWIPRLSTVFGNQAIQVRPNLDLNEFQLNRHNFNGNMMFDWFEKLKIWVPCFDNERENLINKFRWLRFSIWEFDWNSSLA